MQLWGLNLATPKMKELVGDIKGAERESLLQENMEAAYYSGRVLSGQFLVGAEFQKFFGQCEYILQGESAVIKTSDTSFTGALAE
jgi:hypothetical protein